MVQPLLTACWHSPLFENRPDLTFSIRKGFLGKGEKTQQYQTVQNLIFGGFRRRLRAPEHNSFFRTTAKALQQFATFLLKAWHFTTVLTFSLFYSGFSDRAFYVSDKKLPIVAVEIKQKYSLRIGQSPFMVYKPPAPGKDKTADDKHVEQIYGYLKRNGVSYTSTHTEPSLTI